MSTHVAAKKDNSSTINPVSQLPSGKNESISSIKKHRIAASNRSLEQIDNQSDITARFNFGDINVVNNMQRKVAISEPADVYEREADSVAEQVMRLQSKSSNISAISFIAGDSNTTNSKYGGHQMKDAEEQKINISRKPSGTSNLQAGEQITNEINNVRSSNGFPLDMSTKKFMESAFDYDFSKVNISTDERASRSASSVNALAYTVGNDIVFGQGQYQPNTPQGRRLLAHELTHVVQQRGETIQRQEIPMELKQDVNLEALTETELQERLDLIVDTQSQFNQSSDETDLLEEEAEMIRARLRELAPATGKTSHPNAKNQTIDSYALLDEALGKSQGTRTQSVKPSEPSNVLPFSPHPLVPSQVDASAITSDPEFNKRAMFKGGVYQFGFEDKGHESIVRPKETKPVYHDEKDEFHVNTIYGKLWYNKRVSRYDTIHEDFIKTLNGLVYNDDEIQYYMGLIKNKMAEYSWPNAPGRDIREYATYESKQDAALVINFEGLLTVQVELLQDFRDRVEDAKKALQSMGRTIDRYNLEQRAAYLRAKGEEEEKELDYMYTMVGSAIEIAASGGLDAAKPIYDAIVATVKLFQENDLIAESERLLKEARDTEKKDIIDNAINAKEKIDKLGEKVTRMEGIAGRGFTDFRLQRDMTEKHFDDTSKGTFRFGDVVKTIRDADHLYNLTVIQANKIDDARKRLGKLDFQLIYGGTIANTAITWEHRNENKMTLDKATDKVRSLKSEADYARTFSANSERDLSEFRQRAMRALFRAPGTGKPRKEDKKKS